MKTPAQRLLGETLEGNWKVVEHLDLRDITSGGSYSESYIVQHESGRRAFLKALDYERLLRFEPDPAPRLNALTAAYLYERELLRRCGDRRLDRVVLAIADGAVRIPGGNLTDVVQYLILELGEGDLRVQASKMARFDQAMILRALHHMATGLNQLHSLQIAHQDLKPSNVVLFPAKTFKVTDLGSGTLRGSAGPYDDKALVGDPAYAPPELLYRHIDGDWHRRRFGCDVYLLGSMVVYCFTGLALTPSLRQFLEPTQLWGVWSGTYIDVVPFLRDGLERVLETVGASLHVDIRQQVVQVIRELCDPDPALRGDPATRAAGLTRSRPLHRSRSQATATPEPSHSRRTGTCAEFP